MQCQRTKKIRDSSPPCSSGAGLYTPCLRSEFVMIRESDCNALTVGAVVGKGSTSERPKGTAAKWCKGTAQGGARGFSCRSTAAAVL